ncbi:MAG TPA: CHASE3 domain-containing protein, partial [Actinotalea sp.]
MVTGRRAGEGGLVSELVRTHRTLLVTLGAMLLVSVLSTGYLLLSVQPNVDRLSELTRQARLLHIAMLDQETGLRGWLATGDKQFLEPYDRGTTAADDAAEQLVDQGVGDGDIAVRIVDVMAARAAWDSWADDAAQLHLSPAARTNGELSAFLMRGKRLFDAYRTTDGAATELIVGHRDTARERQRVALVAVLALNLALTLLATERALARRRRLTTTVIDPVADLLTTIDALAAGDLGARAGTTHVVELDAMGAALAALAEDVAQSRSLAAARDARLTLMAARL